MRAKGSADRSEDAVGGRRRAIASCSDAGREITRRQAILAAGACLALPAFGCAARGAPRDGRRELLEAVRRGELERVRALLADDARLARARDDAGRSAFVLAMVHGHEAVAQLLRASGLELDLVEAVLAQEWERVETLAAEHPELLNAAHPVGGSPLYAAALTGSMGAFHLRALGCDPDAAPAGGTGFTPARGALEAPHPSWARRALSELCGNGADVNARQRGGSSVLHGAVARRDPELVRLAIRKGADALALDERGRSPLVLAEELGWEEGARLLAAAERLPRDNRASRFALDASRAPVRRPDLSDVPAALQQRVTGSSHNDLERVRELVGADPRLTFSISGDDELAIEACAHVGAREIIRFHLDHGAPLSLPTAVALGDLETMVFWLERDPTLVHERGAHDQPPMWYAIGRGSTDAAEVLVHYGASVDQESMGATALHWCVRRDDPELARWLLERGAAPEPLAFYWERTGQTPLELASERGNERLVALLRDGGARR